MVLKYLKNAAKKVIFPLLVGATLLSGCDYSARAQATNNQPAITQSSKNLPNDFYFRHPGMGGYSQAYSNIFDENTMYPVKDRDGKNVNYFNEEKSIKYLRLSDNNTKGEFTINPLAFDYAEKNGCDLKAGIVFYKDKVIKAIIDNSGSITENKANLIVSPGYDIQYLRASLYCIHNDDPNTSENEASREVIASYPLINYINQINGGGLASAVKPSQTSLPPSQAQGGAVSSPSGAAKPVSGGSVQGSQYSEGSENKDTEYHLRINCGNGELPIKSVVSPIDGEQLLTDKFGMVTLPEPMSCSVYPDDPTDSFKGYSINPPEASANASVINSGNKLGIYFNKPKEEYQVIAETQKYDQDILFVHVDEKVLPAGTIAGKTGSVDGKDSPATLKENPLNFLDKSVYGKDEINAQIFYRKTPLNRWKELKENGMSTETLNNGFSTKRANRLSYKELFKPHYTRLNNGMGHLSVSNIDNLKIIPQDGYELSILKIKEETDEGMLPSNKYYFVLKSKNDVDIVEADVYLNKTLKKLKGAALIPFVNHDFLDRSPKFNSLVTEVPVKDYENYLTKSYNIKHGKIKPGKTGVKTGLKGIHSSKNPEERKVSTIYLKNAANLKKLQNKNGYKVELKYESLRNPVLAKYNELERLLLPTPYTVKDMHNVNNFLESVCAGDQQLNEFLYMSKENRRLLIETFVNPEFEELKGALTTTAILGGLAGTNVFAPAASSSGASSTSASGGAAGGTITGGNL